MKLFALDTKYKEITAVFTLITSLFVAVTLIGGVVFLIFAVSAFFIDPTAT